VTRRSALLFFGAVAFLIALIATLPASLIVGHIGPRIALSGAYGSIWSGGADQVSLDGAPFGAIEWTGHPLALLRGRLAYHIVISQPAGHLSGEVAVGLGGTIEASAVEFGLPINALSAIKRPDSWQGEVSGRVDRAVIEQGWPSALSANLTLSGLRPPGAAFELGSYALELDPAASKPDTIVGRIKDVSAPLTVRAQLEVKRDRSYTIEGEVTPKPGTPSTIASQLAFLGPADQLGRHSFSVSGNF
jgi:general secretion pathway protein N